ncbi:hypothetical protein [Thiocapsa sp. UBA6158]|uniref:hypothetical protein n=1 Tax=Thiocapsa sp. UBA6158 TaxID=1947692 RepID=UPI0025F62737|nr:hypothetical protein [Thiocapsa sp. UBA6158]
MDDLTPIERAVVAMLKRPAPFPVPEVKADFIVRAYGDPSDVIAAVFAAVDWDAIAARIADVPEV